MRLLRDLTLSALEVFLLTANASAAVISNPTRVTGSGAIDPANSRDVNTDATNVTTQASLEGLTGFGAVQTWTGLDNFSTSSVNILSFTDPLLSDVRFTTSGSTPNANSGGLIDNVSYATSDTTGMRITGAGGTSTVTLTIDFGAWDGTTFDTNANAVRGAGFTISALPAGNTLSAQYFDSSNLSLVTQVLTGVQA